MSINRSKVNALVDDDGSGTTGTLYNKARVVDIYDDVDLLLPNRVNIPYAAGNFTGIGGMTVTVDLADLVVHSYQVANKLMTLWFEVGSASISGTPASQIRVALPAGFTVAARAWNMIRVQNNAAPAVGAVLCDPTIPTQLLVCADPSAGSVNWALSTNNTGFAGFLVFPVT